jgi:hypothetical protein
MKLIKMLDKQITDKQAADAFSVNWREGDSYSLHSIPDYMRGAFRRWVMWGIPPGSFLEAVAANDLFEAVGRADDNNQSCLADWVKAFYNAAPMGASGGVDRVIEWNKRGGLLGWCADCKLPLDIPGDEDSASNSVGDEKICNRCADHRADSKHAAQIMGG